jgi:tRNA uridine 5-carboxymethylaminomethyl modification enzyme
MKTEFSYDVIVVGAGHAGVEAAYAAARRGSKTALITLKKDRIGYMPCNPAVGGIGKGHIVFEISALGGLMPKLCTRTYLQVRMLNTSKGPAVHGLRLQIDKNAYSKAAQEELAATENLTIIEGMVEEILTTADKQVTGIRLADGTVITAPSVVITTGTFLNGLVHIGLHNYASGREEEEPAINLSNSLRNLGLTLGRLKTGTPPRLLASSIDFTRLEKQQSDNLDYLFEFYPHNTTTKRDCYITHTNEKVHQIIKDNAHLSPILRKEITGTGPRYCPSIEDKITRFPNKTAHQIFVEPESLSTEWIYPNGLSTSLPLEIQKQYINAIKGFEQAVIVRAGYAIEYDMVLPNQLYPSLETKQISGLFLAGQINGTTGYEEAAGQGIIAGINASLKAEKKGPFILDRNESYIGIMIDDLTTMSIDEPYRMFTSRAERRLLLRQDNSFLRLTDKAYAMGLIDETMYKDFSQEKDIIASTIKDLRAGNNNTDLLRLFGDNGNACQAVTETTGKILGGRPSQTIQAEIKYAPYIEREELEAGRLKKHQTMKFPEEFEFMGMEGLSTELQQKLTKIKPATLAQAGLIPGMTPAALSLLMLRINMFHRKKQVYTPYKPNSESC